MPSATNQRQIAAIVRNQQRDAQAGMKGTEDEQIPAAPEPEGMDPTGGTETAQAMAGRFMPNAVRLFAGVAFGRGNKVTLHTRVVAAGHLVKIAAGMVDEAPEPDGE